MKTIRLTIELTYDSGIMHGEDERSKQWFFNEILNGENGDLVLHSNEIGDTIGTVKVIQHD